MDNENAYIGIETKVYGRIMSTIGSVRTEAGGMIGGYNGVVTEFYYDDPCGRKNVDDYVHIPNVNHMNQILEDWYARNIEFMGIIHSHPADMKTLSFTDIRYAQKLIKDNDMNYVLFPIIVMETVPVLKMYRVDLCSVVEMKVVIV